MDRQVPLRIDTFSVHPSYYYDFKDELKEFVNDNWAEWTEHWPEWLTDDVTGYIDDKYISVAEVQWLKEEGGGKRRRRSAFCLKVEGREQHPGNRYRRSKGVQGFTDQ